MCCGCDTSYIVSVHIQCQASIWTLSLCRGLSWRVRLANQETLTPSGRLVSPLVCRGPWMPTVVTIVGATVKVHQFFCILHICHTCSLCHVELVVKFPARGSTQILLCLFLVCCGCDTSYIVPVHIQCQATIWTMSFCRGLSWRVRQAKQDTLTPPGQLVSPLVCRGLWMPIVVLYCWCHSDSASALLYLIFLSHLFPLPCGAGSTVPREGFDSNVIMHFSWCVVAVTLTIYIVSVHIQFQATIWTLSFCRGLSWRMKLAKKETLTPPGHLISPLVCRGPWMPTVTLYCWCHSDSAPVILYFTFDY